MGILDDAIRQHLELKRQHGAGDDDLDRLEKEAFGPAARPGDPEFVDPDAPAAEGESGEQPVAEAPSEEMASEAPSEEIPAAEAPSEEILGVEGETAAERARVEYANLDDTADHPAPTQLGPADEAEPVPNEPAPSAAPPAAEEPPSGEQPVEAPEGGIFNADDFDFGDLDLELDAEDQPEAAVEAPSEEAPIIEAPSASEPVVETPVEPVEVAEEPIPEDEPARQDAATDAPPPVKESPSEEQPVETSSTQDWAAPVAEPAAEPEAKPAEGEGTEEDLLEETPDFLQETEGEDLWFEQGPPRDFDFDDD